MTCTQHGVLHGIHARVAIFIEGFNPARHPIIKRDGLNFGDVNTHVAVDTAASQTNKTSNVDGRPRGSFGAAVGASFVLILTEKGSKSFLGFLSLLFGGLFGPIRAVCHRKYTGQTVVCGRVLRVLKMSMRYRRPAMCNAFAAGAVR